jgi:hypothetical protein
LQSNAQHRGNGHRRRRHNAGAEVRTTNNGGIGLTKEYKIQLYFRRQKWMELMWGDADYYREKIAQLMEV